MIRNRVVLPEPEGPSSASNSPSATFKSTLSSAANAPNFFMMFLTSIILLSITPRTLIFVQMTFENGFCDQRDQREHGQKRSDRERGDELIFVVEDFH